MPTGEGAQSVFLLMSRRGDKENPTSKASLVCRHCGTPFRAGQGEGEFCCSGCEYVYHLIQGSDLGRFYELKGTRKVEPVGSGVFRPVKFPWLRPLVEAAEAVGAPVPELELSLQGVSCVGCVWLIERLFAEWHGAVDAVARAASGSIRLRWKRGECDLVGFAERLQKFGYTLGPPRGADGKPPALSASKKLLWRVGVSAAMAMNTMLFTLPSYLGLDANDRLNTLFDAMILAFATLSFAVGGSYFIERAWQSLRRGALHIDLPIALGLVLAYAASVAGWALGERTILYFDFVAVFAFLMLGGRWFQEQAVERNRARLIEAGARLDPVLLVEEGGVERSLPAEQCSAGDRLLIPSGSHLPVRARLDSGHATLDLSWINGESVPRSYVRGEVMPAGSRNLGGQPLACQALESWSQSLLAALFEVTERFDTRNPARERAIGLYLLAVLVVAAAGGMVWAGRGDWLQATQVVVSILVVSCPCSLGVALPLIEEIGVGMLRKVGVFVRMQDVFSRIAGVDAIMLDKTGTITLDEMRLDNPQALDALDPSEKALLLKLAGSSLHPVSVALHDRLLAGGVHPADDLECPPEEIPGMGIQARANGVELRFGRPSWAAPGDAGVADATCVFSRDGRAVAAFRLSEALRDGAEMQCARLASAGYTIHILSGDRTARVHAMADRLGIPRSHAHGDLSPQDKARIIRDHGSSRVCLIGDGANDSLAFDQAACTGTPAIDRGLLENKSDFYFTGRSLDGLGHLLDTASRARIATRNALLFATSYNLATISVSLAGHMSPLLAAILMPSSSVATLALVWLSMRRPSRGGCQPA